MNESVSIQTDFTTKLLCTDCAVVFYLDMYVIPVLGEVLSRNKFFSTKAAWETLPKVLSPSVPVDLGPVPGGKFTQITVFSQAFMGDPDMN